MRPEAPPDFDAIDSLLRQVMGAPEAKLVRLLRGSPAYRPELALVAADGDALLGHVMLTAAVLDAPGGPVEILTLAPLAVLPERQGSGVGSALVEAALAAAGAAGRPLVTVVGGPYYLRFGFTPAGESGISAADPRVPPEHLYVRRLSAYRPSMRGRFTYPAAFAAVM